MEHDLYIFGSQEAVRPILNSMINPSKELLDRFIKDYFEIDSEHNNGEFVMVNSNSLAAISIIVIIKK